LGERNLLLSDDRPIEALFAETLLFRGQSQMPSAKSEKLSDVRRVRNCSINEGPSAHLGAFGFSVGRDIQPSIGIRAAFTNGSIFKIAEEKSR